MFTKYLQSENVRGGKWLCVMPGVQVCRFSLDHLDRVEAPSLVPALEPLHFEILFCRSGRLVLRRTKGRLAKLGAGEILLLSDESSLLNARIDQCLSGVLVSVDAQAARERLRDLCGLLGNLQLDTREAKRCMDKQEGCAILRGAPWSWAPFEELEELPEGELERYCAFKSFELLYLLCTQEKFLEEEKQADPSGGYLVRTVMEIRAYMESHLEEKLTIADLSRRFCISATAFKACFRQLYNQPVHGWLQEQRMKRAADLLRNSSMSVLEIAQAVGYEGASQFNLTFKRRYGITPRQYAKMSESGKI